MDDVLRLARQLSALDRMKLIQQLAPELAAGSAAASLKTANSEQELDDQYQRGYEQIPEDTSDLEALLPHLPVAANSGSGAV